MLQVVVGTSFDSCHAGVREAVSLGKQAVHFLHSCICSFISTFCARSGQYRGASPQPQGIQRLRKRRTQAQVLEAVVWEQPHKRKPAVHVSKHNIERGICVHGSAYRAPLIFSGYVPRPPAHAWNHRSYGTLDTRCLVRVATLALWAHKRDLNRSTETPQEWTDNQYVYKVTNRWEALDKGMTHILAGTEQDSQRFHHNGEPMKTYINCSFLEFSI